MCRFSMWEEESTKLTEKCQKERVCLLNKEERKGWHVKIKNFSHNSLHPLFSFHEAACERVTCSIRRGPVTNCLSCDFFFPFLRGMSMVHNANQHNPPSCLFMRTHSHQRNNTKKLLPLAKLARFYPTSPTRPNRPPLPPFPLLLINWTKLQNMWTCCTRPKHAWQIF